MNWQKRFFEKVNKMNSLKQERGSILVLTVILLPIMFAFLGFAFDFGNIYMHKARLQNVADAAALAGARAYLNSQTSEDLNDRDSVDGIVDRTGGKLAANSSATYKEGRSTPDVYNVRDTQKTKNRDYSNHKAADRAADEYIYHNIANLGNVVKSDRWSHYAINSDNTDPKTFYRVGLYEEVPLYFLPIIQSIGKTQTVRAGAIAVVEKGTTNPGGGGTTPTITHTSVFDNLYTYSYAFDSALSNEQGHTVSTSYSGDMVFTYGDGDPNVFYDMPSNNLFVDHLFTDTDKNNLNTSSSSYNWSKVNDPIIDTNFKTTDYIPAFRAKLNAPHGGPKNQNQLTDENINNHNSDLYLTYVTVGGKQVYKDEGENGKLFVPVDNNTFFAYDDENNDYVYVAGREHTEANRVKYVFVGDNGGKIYAPSITDNGRQYLLDENNAMTDSYYENWSIHYGNKSPYSFKAKFSDSLQERHQYKKHVVTNVFYVDTKNNGNYAGSVTIQIDSAIHGTTEEVEKNVPIYIIVEEDIQAIDWKVSNNGRPVVLVYFGSGPVKFEQGNGNIKALIYAPYATFPNIHATGNFHGSIVAKSIYYQASGVGNSWYQDNYLEGKYGYTDSDVAAVTQTIKNKIENAAKLPDNIIADIFSQYASALNIDVSEIKSDNWYSKQSYANKQKLYTKWKQLYAQFKDQYPQYLNQLWPWNEHFDVQGEPVATDGTLRLINYRTDYLDNGQANAVVDPFIFLSLEKPDAY